MAEEKRRVMVIGNGRSQALAALIRGGFANANLDARRDHLKELITAEHLTITRKPCEPPLPLEAMTLHASHSHGEPPVGYVRPAPVTLRGSWDPASLEPDRTAIMIRKPDGSLTPVQARAERKLIKRILRRNRIRAHQNAAAITCAALGFTNKWPTRAVLRRALRDKSFGITTKNFAYAVLTTWRRYGR